MNYNSLSLDSALSRICSKLGGDSKGLKLVEAHTVQRCEDTSVRYSTCEADGPKKRESRVGLRLFSPSLA